MLPLLAAALVVAVLYGALTWLSGRSPRPASQLASWLTLQFRKPVRPGDQLRLEVTVLKYKMGYAKLRAEAYVDGQLVTEAVISSALADRPK